MKAMGFGGWHKSRIFLSITLNVVDAMPTTTTLPKMLVADSGFANFALRTLKKRSLLLLLLLLKYF